MPSAVLVAEPEPETREYLGRHLRDDGFDVLGAARRSEALELAERARPDVILLAELDLCLRLRRGEPGRTWDRNVPVRELRIYPFAKGATPNEWRRHNSTESREPLTAREKVELPGNMDKAGKGAIPTVARAGCPSRDGASGVRRGCGRSRCQCERGARGNHGRSSYAGAALPGCPSRGVDVCSENVSAAVARFLG